ncbi:L-threonylcarbamoyladenylate synthase [Alkalimonas sp. MEB108]|uniref:Threonylcarbamoyl-AMP synthase n=1 Tax=Alkalimonas cellulosilytica TaxID=3058395 RepID=A0ABU7JA59_9GAMM|nr:L-threonylcarbamoyladenylate synthase [Alkalimonas sp. MEB108]MEE2003396.1 L-threonylcarbamoyladenylate synthase [Alkalimonas sp. MEB108]
MTTLQLDPTQPDELAMAARLLQQGRLVAVPTETVYGLAADARNPDAVAGIFTAKGRPADHPLIVHLPSADAMADWAVDIPASAWQLAKAFWPGPLTLLLKKAPHVSPVITGGLPTIGLRVPAHPVLHQLLQQHQLAVAAPSANRYKKLSPTSAQQVLHTLDGRIDAVLDGGDCSYGLESTIVDATCEPLTIVRAGPIQASELSQMLGQPVLQPEQHQVKVAGNVRAHYQPNTPVIYTSFQAELPAQVGKAQQIAILHLGPVPKALRPIWQQQMPADAKAYGRKLYRALADADHAGADLIVLESPPEGEAWLAVWDRLKRASYQG